MPNIDIILNKQKIQLQKSITSPKFTAKTILVNDNWDFVELWLRRSKKQEALFFWKQARAFNEATQHLTKLSSPLTAYYTLLNATKALLISKGQTFKPYHGVSGSSDGSKSALSNEHVQIEGEGVLPALCRLLNESVNGEHYNLKDIFYNLAYIHRAYCVTFTTAEEIFVPITEAKFTQKQGSTECWFSAIIPDKKYQKQKIISSLDGMEIDKGVTDKFVIRKKKRFQFSTTGRSPINLDPIVKEHKKIRESTYYIYGLTRLWYIKRTKISKPNSLKIINRSHLSLTFMALHRLSELARYSPHLLERHFNSSHNWLVSQFIERSLNQFIDECSAEITGHDFMLPGYTSR